MSQILKQNPGYMKENFMICIESLHISDTGEQENVRQILVNFNVVCWRFWLKIKRKHEISN